MQVGGSNAGMKQCNQVLWVTVRCNTKQLFVERTTVKNVETLVQNIEQRQRSRTPTVRNEGGDTMHGERNAVKRVPPSPKEMSLRGYRIQIILHQSLVYALCIVGMSCRLGKEIFFDYTEMRRRGRSEKKLIARVCVRGILLLWCVLLIRNVICLGVGGRGKVWLSVGLESHWR
jgi:hypothetical protein